MYVSASEIERLSKDTKNRKLNAGGADERELEEALQRSLKDIRKEEGGRAGDDEDEGAPSVGTILNGGKAPQGAKPSFEAFKGQGVSFGASA
jgi:hypothetical protein